MSDTVSARFAASCASGRSARQNIQPAPPVRWGTYRPLLRRSWCWMVAWNLIDFKKSFFSCCA